MGLNESKSKYGGMVIQTDKQYYVSGHEVTGKIYVLINETYPAKWLKLRIRGMEKCHWFEERRDTLLYQGLSHHSTHYEEHHKKDTVFFFEGVVYEFNQGSINPGQY